jgi:tetratricopeptide (TPR) repeat protein
MLTLKDSIELHRQGRLEEAEQGYRALVASEPDNTDAMFMLAVARRLRGDAIEAEQLFERVAQARPNEGDVQLHLASTRYLNGKIEEARIGYASALELDPNLIGAHIGLGQLALNSGNENLAENHFRIALRAGEDGHALTGLGVAARRGDWDAALRYLTRAAELVPQYPLTQFLLGQAFACKGLTTFAQQALETALRLEPSLHDVRPWLAEVLMHTGQPRAAEKHYLADAPGARLRSARLRWPRRCRAGREPHGRCRRALPRCARD